MRNRLFDQIHVNTRVFTVMVGLALAGWAGVARAEEPASDKPVDPDAPLVGHVPVTTAVRGVPVDISATLHAQAGSVLTSQTVLVRLTDVGTPMPYSMVGKDGEENAYHAVLPVTAIEGVTVFWYAIDARDSQGRIGGTPWIRVVIIEPIAVEGAIAPEDAAAAAGGTGGGKTLAIVAGALLLGGGAAVLIENENDDGSGGGDDDEDLPPPPSAAPPSNNNPPPPSPPAPPAPTNTPCTGLTGSESVTYDNLSLCDNGADIEILVCGTCPNATIEASGNWGESDSITGYNNPSCSPTAQRLLVPKTDGFPTPGSHTLTVFSNGQVIDSIPWPPLSDFDCF